MITPFSPRQTQITTGKLDLPLRELNDDFNGHWYFKNTSFRTL